MNYFTGFTHSFLHRPMLIGGQDGVQVVIDAAMGNRHGVISGATGTGKTITLQILYMVTACYKPRIRDRVKYNN